MQTKQTMPEIARNNPQLEQQIVEMLCNWTEFQHTAQILATLCVQANADRNIAFNVDSSADKMAQIEDLLCKAAQLYLEIGQQEESAE